MEMVFVFLLPGTIELAIFFALVFMLVSTAAMTRGIRCHATLVVGSLGISRRKQTLGNVTWETKTLQADGVFGFVTDVTVISGGWDLVGWLYEIPHESVHDSGSFLRSRGQQ